MWAGYRAAADAAGETGLAAINQPPNRQTDCRTSDTHVCIVAALESWCGSSNSGRQVQHGQSWFWLFSAVSAV